MNPLGAHSPDQPPGSSPVLPILDPEFAQLPNVQFEGSGKVFNGEFPSQPRGNLRVFNATPPRDPQPDIIERVDSSFAIGDDSDDDKIID